MLKMFTKLNTSFRHRTAAGTIVFRKRQTGLFAALCLLFITCALSSTSSAQTITFESPTYTLGNINGQDGWIKTGPYDSAVSATSVPGFGSQALRISNAITSGSFGDQTFSKSATNEAGETTAQNGGLSGGTRNNRFVTEFNIASAVPGSQQPGLLMGISPDRGDGARMSLVRFEDQADGIHVIFFDYVDSAPFGTTIAANDPLGCGTGDDFVSTDIATLDRTTAHTIKLVIDFVDGSRNDVVNVYVDGVLRKTGTSWEDYFRYCEGTQPRTVDSILFRTSGTAAPATSGNGFFVDGLTMSSAVAAPTVQKVTANDLTAVPNLQSWFFYNDETDTINNSLGTFVNGPGTAPSGAGSAQMSASGTQRRNLATYQFSGTPLANITTLRYSTYNPSAGNGGGSPNRSGYLQFNVDFNGTDTFQRRLVFLPSDNGTVTQNTWKEWDAVNGGNALWRYSGSTWAAGVGGGGEPGTTTKTWSQILSQYPGVRIRVTDPFLGIRVGEPYPDGYTENIDLFKFGTASGTTHFDFEPLPIVVDADGSASSTDCNAAGSPFTTIQAAVNAATPGATIKVCPGNYVEDVNVNKANIILQGSGIDISTITGDHTVGDANSLLINASGVTVEGFTITRTGNTVAAWATNGQRQGVNFAAPGSGSTLQNCKITGNRNGIYVGQSSHNNTIRRNIIDFNRTGIHLVDNNNTLIEENFITNNWTMGILYRTEGGAASSIQTVRNNKIAGNWFSEVENRDTPGTAVFNVSGNNLGTTNVTRVTTTSMEPDYASQIPVAYGGTAVAPASHPTIAGPQSARIDYSPFLNSGIDTQPGTPGFQGDFNNLTVNPNSPQANGAAGNIQEGINLTLTGGSVTAVAGTYTGNVDINKAVTLRGTPTIAGSLTTSIAGAVISPGFSPGIINSGNLSLSPASTVSIELNGTTPGSGHDQLNVTGTVALGGAVLAVTTSYSAVIGNSFVIVNNDGADAVSGTFNGLSEGATFIVGGTTFQISYIGGTGNDVVLTVITVTCNNVSVPATTNVPRNTQFIVPITVDDLTGRGILSYTFALNYNSAVVTPVLVANAGTLSSAMTITTNSTPGALLVTANGTMPMAGSGTLLNITFISTSGIGTTSNLSFSSFAFNEGVPCVNTTSGIITVISGVVSGAVTYVNAAGPPSGPPLPVPVPNTTLSAAGSIPVSTTSGATGLYSLSGLGAGAYTVTPSKTGNVNGITGFDSARISQHVVNLITLNSTQLIAADVSGNGTVTAFDAALISQYVVNIPNPGSTGTWRFTPVNRSYPNVETNQTNQDYGAILMGDVSGNWNPTAPNQRVSLGLSEKTEAEAGRATVVSAPANQFAMGAFSVPLMVQNTTGQGIIAYQYDLTFNQAVITPQAIPCEVAGTLSSSLGVTCNAGTPGLLEVTVSGSMPISGAGVLMNLKFNAVGAPGTISPLTFSNFMFNEGIPAGTATNGQVTIAGPTAASVSLSGRLLTVLGRGVANARVTLTDTTGEAQTARSNSTGFYQFENVVPGQTYVLSVTSKRYTFLPQVVSVVDNLVNFDLIAEP